MYNLDDMRKVFLVLFLAFLLFSFIQVEAAEKTGLVPCGGPKQPDCQLCHFFVMINNYIKGFVTYVVPALAVIMIAIGGFMLIFSGGQPEKISQAKSLFKTVIIGLIVIYGAWLFIDAFFAGIGVKPMFRSWNIIFTNCPK